MKRTETKEFKRDKESGDILIYIKKPDQETDSKNFITKLKLKDYLIIGEWCNKNIKFKDIKVVKGFNKQELMELCLVFYERLPKIYDVLTTFTTYGDSKTLIVKFWFEDKPNNTPGFSCQFTVI